MARFYPLGYPVDIETQASAVVDAAAESWSRWKQLFDQPSLRVHVTVNGGATPPGPPTVRATASTLQLFADERNQGDFDGEARSGRLLAARGVVQQRRWFRYHFLDALVLTALDMVAFTPAHAACVARSGRGLLLCGDSGAGKSSLAYACARSGWSFISDDAVHIVRGGGGVVVGNSHRAHLRRDATALFPEIAGIEPVKQPNGKEAIEVAAPGAAKGCTTVGGCVFLSRRTAGRTELGAFDETRARHYFRKYLFWGDRKLQEEDFDSVLRHGCQELRYSGLDDAICALRMLS